MNPERVMIEEYPFQVIEEAPTRLTDFGRRREGWAEPRLKTCPHCDYSLKGLPVEHYCPECGFKYDAATRVWTQDNRMRASGLLVWLMISGFIAWSFTRSVSPGSAPIELQYGVMAVFLLILFRSILLASRRPTVVTGPEGVTFRVGWSRGEFVPYELIEETDSILQSGRSFVYICLRDGTRIDCTPAMSDEDAVYQFTSELSQRIKLQQLGD